MINYRNYYRIFLIWCIIFYLEGCSFTMHYEQLMLLKRLGDSQHEIEDYVKKQKDSFLKLRDDIKNNRLKKGISKREILSIYGEPVFCKDIANEVGVKEICLYRQPLQYFSTDRAYLKFDKKQNLCCWEFISGSQEDAVTAKEEVINAKD
ncbi:MAG: hypothetical protein KKB22_00220 [Candidatus Omnitrophica bacterium]|nr:hypothetical protein [Candidatus Omnitrophota bacterium]